MRAGLHTANQTCLVYLEVSLHMNHIPSNIAVVAKEQLMA